DAGGAIGRAERACDEAGFFSCREFIYRRARELRSLQIDLVSQRLHAVIGERDALRVEGIGLDQVGAGFEIFAMDLADDLRLRQHQQVVVPLEIARPVAKALDAILRLLELVALDHGAHRPVQDQDPLGEQALQRGAVGHGGIISSYPDKRITTGSAPAVRCFDQCNPPGAARNSPQSIRVPSMLRSKVTRIAPYIGAIPQFLAAAPTPALAETHPVIDELADVAKDALNQQIRGALAGASRYFTARAEKTEDERLRRDFLDALHALRLSVASVQRACAVELDRVMTQAPADAKSEPAPITALCQSLWDGLREQLDALCVKFQVTPFAPRLSPENLRAAIRHGVGRADLSQRTIALTQDLVEHGVLAHLDQVYRRVAERLEQYSLPGVATQFPVAVNQPAMPAPATSLHVDPHTKALLVEVAQTREPDAARKSSYGNAELATELLESLKTERSHGAVPVRSRAVAQRLALVGRMFGVIGADVRLPDAFRRAFEKLRFPIIKSALADSNFFTQKSHSLRMITADLVQRAIAHADSTHQLQALIGSAAGNFDLSATFVRPVLAGLRPLQAAA